MDCMIEQSCSTWRETMEKIESKSAFKKRMDGIKLPEGFTGTYTELDEHNRAVLTYVVEKVGDCSFHFRYETGDGTTKYNTKAGPRTFDRIGVDSSFYHRPHSWEKKAQP